MSAAMTFTSMLCLVRSHQLRCHIFCEITDCGNSRELFPICEFAQVFLWSCCSVIIELVMYRILQPPRKGKILIAFLQKRFEMSTFERIIYVTASIGQNNGTNGQYNASVQLSCPINSVIQ